MEMAPLLTQAEELLPIFSGDVAVALDTPEALAAVEGMPATYFLGSDETEMIVHDLRPKGNGRAFNRPAYARIFTSLNGIEVELHATRKRRPAQTLWLGVINDGSHAAAAQWEILRPVGSRQTARLALL
jgi:hypothetical protein